jgi:hypothetical protein
MSAADLIVYGIVIHLIADWLLQNDWMAANKAIPFHPAGNVHASIHAVGMALIFDWEVALAIGVIHYFIDLRFPLRWWRRVFRQTTTGDVALHVAIWGDQVAHIAVIAVIALLVQS